MGLVGLHSNLYPVDLTRPADVWLNPDAVESITVNGFDSATVITRTGAKHYVMGAAHEVAERLAPSPAPTPDAVLGSR